jgi:hypothetical protein
MRDKHQVIEEPDEVKVSRPVLKTSGTGDSLAEFNPATNIHIKLPKIGAIPINLHRPIPSGFVVKQVRITRKADRWLEACAVIFDPA